MSQGSLMPENRHGKIILCKNFGGLAMEQVDLERTQAGYLQWKAAIKQKLFSAGSFEIHCWSDESEWTEKALQYGTLKKTDWSYGNVVCGKVTPEFIEMLLNMPRPADTEPHPKMTPFFSIFLDNGFSSEHYGTELCQL